MNTLTLEKLRLDNSIYKLTEGHSVIVLPKFNLESDDPILSYSWNFGSMYSTFKESRDETSFIERQALTSKNQEKVALKVSNVSEGEVVFFLAALTVTTQGESFSTSSTITIYRGDPISKRVPLTYVRNGRMAETLVYDNSIEQRIINANKNSEFLQDETAINNSLLTNEDIPQISTPNTSSDNFVQIGMPTDPHQMYSSTAGSDPDCGLTSRSEICGASPPSAKKQGKHSQDPESDNLEVVREKVRRFILGIPPGYSSIIAPVPMPGSTEHAIKVPGRSTHKYRFAPGFGEQPSRGAAPIYMPYPCGGETDSSGGGCDCREEVVTDILTFEEEQCIDPEAQEAETITKEIKTKRTVVTCTKTGG
jgi:hypothetical protein